MKNLLKLICVLILIIQAISSFGQKVKPDKVFKKYQIITLSIEGVFVKVKEKKGGVFKVKIHNWNLDLRKSDFISRKYRSLDENYDLVDVGSERVIPMIGETKKGGKVALTIGVDYLYGYVMDQGKKTFIEPADYYDVSGNASGKNSYILYNVEDIIPGEIQYCGSDEELVIGDNLRYDIATRQVGLCYQIDYAICNDYSMVQKYGSAVGAEQHAIGVLNSILSNYDDEFPDGINFVLTGTYNVTTAGSDPWSSSTEPGILLSSFADWAPGGLSFIHDIASLWTDRDLDENVIGVAYVKGLCNYYGKYNVVQDFANDPELKRVLLAHEIGHNLGSQHDPSGSSYIMAPSVSYSTTWSPTSISAISGFISTRSCTAICPGTTPQVFFDNELTVDFESSNSGPLAGCDDYYKDVAETVSITHYPDETILVNIEVDPTSTAIEGSDFVILNNQVEFNTYGGLDKSVSIRIIDDNWEEGQETIVLNLSIQSGNAIVGQLGQMEIIIDSPLDEVSNECCSTIQTYEIGQAINYTNIMFWGHSEDIRSRMIIPASELIASGLQEGNINQLGVYVRYKNSTGIFNDFRVGMKNVSETNLSSSPWYSTTQVYLNDYSSKATQWNYFNFQEPFYWDGISSIYIQFCFNNDFVSASDFIATMSYSQAGGNEMMGTRVGSNSNGCSLSQTSNYYYYNDRLPYVRFNQFGPLQYEDQILASSENSVKKGETGHFYSNTGGLIATIANTGNQDLDCVSVTLHDNGNGKNLLPGSSDYFGDKIIQIETDYNASYELTIYMRPEQLETWLSAKPNLNFLQSNVSPELSNSNNRSIIGQTEYFPSVIPGEASKYITQVIGEGYFSLTNGFQKTVFGHFGGADFRIKEKNKGIVLQNGLSNYYQITMDTLGFLKSLQDNSINFQSEFTGDLLLPDAQSGLILKDEKNQNWRITLDNVGQFEYQLISSIPGNIVELEYGNFCIQSKSKGLVLKNQEGECWRIYIDDFGNIGSLRIQCLNY
jgi:hypothetical protein